MYLYIRMYVSLLITPKTISNAVWRVIRLRLLVHISRFVDQNRKHDLLYNIILYFNHRILTLLLPHPPFAYWPIQIVKTENSLSEKQTPYTYTKVATKRFQDTHFEEQKTNHVNRFTR